MGEINIIMFYNFLIKFRFWTDFKLIKSEVRSLTWILNFFKKYYKIYITFYSYIRSGFRPS